VLERHDDLGLGVFVAHGTVGDAGGLGGVGQCGDALLDELVVGVDAGDHQTVAVAPDRLLQDAGQLAVSVGHELSPGSRLARLCHQRVDDHPQGEQRFVNFNALLCVLALGPGESDALGARQVHEVQFAGLHQGGVSLFVRLHPDHGDGVGSRRALV
jgi:hypothetical protein